MAAGLSRRGFMAGIVAAAAAAACSSGSDRVAPTSTAWPATSGSPPTSAGISPPSTDPGPDLPLDVFTLGVASGDPLPDSVILWTRLAPDPLHGGGMPDAEVPVVWEVARDPSFATLVASGVATASPTFAHSVHVDAKGLEPGTRYHYRFTAGLQRSPVGIARTAPAAGAEVDRLRFLFASCQDWTDGYWTAWPHAADEQPDLILFLGDYIYESGVGDPGAVRKHNSDEVVTLGDYRNRYALYKGDPGLQRAHAVAPWVLTWDDHEVENNYAGESPQDPHDGVDFAQRRAAAYQAFYEHQAIRVRPPDQGHDEIYRTIDWGGLARFHVLDGRQYRSDQPCQGVADLARDCSARHAAGATMLGAAQEQWLGRQFASSKAAWNVIANQVIFTPLPLGGVFFNMDQWDGYPEARTRLLGQIAATKLSNPVFVTGDIHASGVADVSDAGPDDPVVATELVGTSISSSFPTELAALAGPVISAVPHVKWFDALHRGYVACDVTQDQMAVRYRLMATTARPTSDVSTATSWVIRSGTPGAQRV